MHDPGRPFVQQRIAEVGRDDGHHDGFGVVSGDGQVPVNFGVILGAIGFGGGGQKLGLATEMQVDHAA